MNRIARFEEFSTNEELFHGYTSKGEGGGIGSKTADKVFRKIGKFFGNSADILNDYLASKVDANEITQSESDKLFDMLEYSCRGKKGPEIQSMVDAKLEEMHGESHGEETEE
jgi:hypothetical protein